MTTANATFQVTGWDEQTYEERDGAGKLTQANVQQAISGDIEGSSDVRWLMAYTADDRAEFVGVQTVTGSLAGKEGSFVLRSVGHLRRHSRPGDLTVVEGSGTGDLAGHQRHRPLHRADGGHARPLTPSLATVARLDGPRRPGPGGQRPRRAGPGPRPTGWPTRSRTPPPRPRPARGAVRAGALPAAGPDHRPAPPGARADPLRHRPPGRPARDGRPGTSRLPAATAAPPRCG